KIWAVGEAAGLVGPASGAGNVFALQSALELVEHLRDPVGYVAALRRRFAPLIPEAAAVRKVLTGRLPNLSELYHIQRGWRLAGVPLFVGTEQTDRYFAWTVLPPITAAFLGASYWASCIFELAAARQHTWARARVAVPAVLIFTTLTMVVTLAYLDRFHLFSP